MKTFEELEKKVSVTRSVYKYRPHLKSSLTNYAKALEEREAQRDHINDVINQVSM